MAQQVKNLPTMPETQEMQVRSLGQEEPLEEENGNPLQYSCLKNPMNRGAWRATVQSVAKVMPELLSMQAESRSDFKKVARNTLSLSLDLQSLPYLCLCKRHMHLLYMCVYTEYVYKHTHVCIVQHFGVGWDDTFWQIMVNKNEVSSSQWLGTGILKQPLPLCNPQQIFRLLDFFPIAFLALAPPTSGLSQLQLLVLDLFYYYYNFLTLKWVWCRIKLMLFSRTHPMRSVRVYLVCMRASAKVARSVYAKGF